MNENVLEAKRNAIQWKAAIWRGKDLQRCDVGSLVGWYLEKGRTIKDIQRVCKEKLESSPELQKVMKEFWKEFGGL